MPLFNLSFDMRSPDFGAPTAKLYAEALDMCAWGDTRGFSYVTVMEHHGAKDGYLPTPFLMGAAVAARTKNLRIQLGAVILPLHDPVKVAEQIAVLDLISNGRVDVVFGAGYVVSEFAMFKRKLNERGKSMDEGIDIIIRALKGERFKADGREIFIRPLPVQKPHPPIYIGGGVPATAKRAAHFGAHLYPLDPAIIPLYKEECAKLGKKPGDVCFNMGWVHVAEDPEKAWKEVGPHIIHLVKSYAEWAEGTTSSSPFEGMNSVEQIKQTGIYQVVTPDECVKLAEERDKIGLDVAIAPVLAGLDPKIGWKSLELLVDKVFPRVNKTKKAA